MTNVKKTILYLDDEQPNLFLFGVIFRNVHEVITVDNTTTALELIKSGQTFDVIISDMKMPKMSGLEFILKAKQHYTSAKYFLMTGFDESEEIEEALKSGLIDGYIKKPFNKESVLAAIHL